MNENYKVLQNEDLNRIQEILIPQKSEKETFTIPPGSSSSKSSSTQSTVATTEFIPHIFYTLYQIQKDPNRSNNQLETKTGLIRHRLRNCKTLIRESDSSLELLSKTTDEWEQFIMNRENELQIKKKVLVDLRGRISEILTNCNYEPDVEETNTEVPIEEEAKQEVQKEVNIKGESEADIKEESSIGLENNEDKKINAPELPVEVPNNVTETDDNTNNNTNNIDNNNNSEMATAEVPDDNNNARSTSMTVDDEAILDDIDMEL
ncbi:Cse2p [Maudiozyma barnettii]|uniref:Mediator of RNA polymerase II transcription subunit 9 n=1 Tax=Maudiozyma barnettii TaxID=61262 RepID=A0A8H2ZH64_9SACH|nr:Cse2p [Kazachstania barnettii]CAB4255399.1 some similarities with Saccharomyces cerevisiae YNR010W CSE2 Subunit of the RNA polymerase II mediator complex [Kazachstania barnettii]